MAQAKDKDLPEEEKSSSEVTALINKRWGLVIMAPKSVLRNLEDGLTARMITPEIQLGWMTIAEI